MAGEVLATKPEFSYQTNTILFSGPESAKSNQNCGHRSAYKQCDSSDFIICSTLSYSNGTNKNAKFRDKNPHL